jgi:hypothetical protein
MRMFWNYKMSKNTKLPIMSLLFIVSNEFKYWRYSLCVSYKVYRCTDTSENCYWTIVLFLQELKVSFVIFLVSVFSEEEPDLNNELEISVSPVFLHRALQYDEPALSLTIFLTNTISTPSWEVLVKSSVRLFVAVTTTQLVFHTI